MEQTIWKSLLPGKEKNNLYYKEWCKNNIERRKEHTKRYKESQPNRTLFHIRKQHHLQYIPSVVDIL